MADYKKRQVACYNGRMARNPTIRQRKAAENLVAKGSSVAQAMRDAGYSPRTVRDPGKLTRSEAFIQLMEQGGLTDSRLVQVLDDGLGATKAVVMGVKSEESFVDVTPDYPTRHKYLETGLRLKGYGKTDSVSINFNHIVQEQRADYDL